MKIKTVDRATAHIYDNLCQAYEAEFSPLTHKQPDANGLFAKDTLLEGNITGYLVYSNDLPAGLAAIKQDEQEGFEVCEFYVVPYYRRHKLGLQFASALFDQMPGNWQIKQIEGADHATAFWRAVVSDYTLGHYQEDSYNDPYWGNVTRQTFSAQKH
ncbi:GNAT family N-acetyltransferase [Pseudovibrio sp. SCP19]|uniref:GNAT family N-acetyltransferase n=1 Tax=Pseudovibrio sp. SCP19 TaxID=3141374 RepID=UPI003335C440